jgi:hypothetical protein
MENFGLRVDNQKTGGLACKVAETSRIGELFFY